MVYLQNPYAVYGTYRYQITILITRVLSEVVLKYSGQLDDLSDWKLEVED